MRHPDSTTGSRRSTPTARCRRRRPRRSPSSRAPFIERADKTWNAYVGAEKGLDRDLRTAAAAHKSLSSIQTITAYLDREVAKGTLAAETADALRAILEPAAEKLTAACAKLVGADVTLTTPTEAVFPGDTARAVITLDVSGCRKLSQVKAKLASSDGWAVTAVGPVSAATVSPGSTTGFAFDVRVPADAEPGRYDLVGSLTYSSTARWSRFPWTPTWPFRRRWQCESVAVEPAAAYPGDVVAVAVDLVNRTDVERSGTVQVTGPDGWAAGGGSVRARGRAHPALSTRPTVEL